MIGFATLFLKGEAQTLSLKNGSAEGFEPTTR
jgi:hypothetical protein